MSGPWALPPGARRIAVGVFLLGLVAYSAIWMAAARRRPEPIVGVSYASSLRPPGAVLEEVAPGGPAHRAGLRSGDLVVAVDGRPIAGRTLLGDVVHRRPAGTALVFRAVRGGRIGEHRVVTEAPAADARPLGRRALEYVLSAYPVPFAAVAFVLLLLRPDDPHAWRLSFLFAGLVAGAPLLPWEGRIPPAARGFAVGWKIAFFGMSAAFFLDFFSRFPEPSAVDRRFPRARLVLLAASALVAVPLAVAALAAGGARPLVAVAAAAGRANAQVVMVSGSVIAYALGLSSLVSNLRSGSAETRRKCGVIAWGVAAGLGPAIAIHLVGAAIGRRLEEFPFPVWASVVLALFLLPLAFTYAVARHRVMDVPVLLRRSARYVLVQRGFLGLLVLLGMGATHLFAASLEALVLAPRAVRLEPAIAMGVVLGTLLVLGGTAIHRRVRERIDRAFFRTAYDARHVLSELAARARTVRSREELVALVGERVHAALRPEWSRAWIASRAGVLVPYGGGGGPLDPTQPALATLARRGYPRTLTEVAPAERRAMGALAEGEAECVVPIVGREGGLLAVFAFGPRRSEEPYAGEDLRLLGAVADQAAVALEAIQLAEEMADRLEVQRRTDEELDLARRAQARLLVHDAPRLATLEYAGRCVQARAVGGDYFDFLDLGPGRMGLVLADVSGKGMAAALLMASLQASLRSTAGAVAEFPARLEPVHTLLLRCSESNRYATLFVAAYDDHTRRLVYANCGHNPPLLLRRRGGVERLWPTSPVIGLLDEWSCDTAEVALDAGDLLVLFSDGVTEARSDADEEFGEARLVGALDRHRDAPVARVLHSVIAEVADFTGGEQEDDVTLVVARVTG